MPIVLNSPIDSLTQGNWFKLICGASFQDLSAVRSLALVYSLAGADCIDVAADPAVITATLEGLEVAKTLVKAAKMRGFGPQREPLIMVSFNDGEDPHFRKAEFDPQYCPKDCPRPCEKICPAKAIAFNEEHRGVIAQRCYGCGRCIPVCPQEIIFSRSYVSTPTAIAPIIEKMGVQAIEIHTHVGHEEDFTRLWQAIAPISNQLKLLAISCPDQTNLINYLKYLYDVISPLPCVLVWQTDGRPMSGDIGIGTTHLAVKLGQKVLGANLPGYVQLAGGTNHHTVTKLKSMGLLKKEANEPFIAGIAYGSYARSLVSPMVEQLEARQEGKPQLENHPDLLWQAVSKAANLIYQLKYN